MTTSLADALFGKTKKSVIGILFSKPDTHVHLRELARMANTSAPMMKRELDGLVEAGILISWRDGNRVAFKANDKCAIFEELRGISRKTFGIADAFKQALAGQDIRMAFIFGSIATGKDRADSDIDLMVLGNIDKYDLYQLIKPLEEILRRPIHLNHYDEEEWVEVSQDRMVLKIINSEKIMVVGNV